MASSDVGSTSQTKVLRYKR